MQTTRQGRCPWHSGCAHAGYCAPTLGPAAISGRVDDLLARFEDVRRGAQLDESAAEMLRRAYV